MIKLWLFLWCLVLVWGRTYGDISSATDAAATSTTTASVAVDPIYSTNKNNNHDRKLRHLRGSSTGRSGSDAVFDDIENAAASTSTFISSSTMPKGRQIVRDHYHQQQRHRQRRDLTTSSVFSGLEPQPRIIGGRDVSVGRYPAMVYLADRVDSLSCGGTLISPTVGTSSLSCGFLLLLVQLLVCVLFIV
jgi:hypothetical protein